MKLQNAEFFGAKGSVSPDTLHFVPSFTTITRAGLNAHNCHIWFSGYDQGWATDEKADLLLWLSRGINHYIIASCDHEKYGDVCDMLGRKVCGLRAPAAAGRLLEYLAEYIPRRF